MQRGSDFEQAAQVVADGGIIAYPTEGVFGLGCAPHNDSAVAKIITLKERASDKGLILIAATRAQLAPYTHSPNPNSPIPDNLEPGIVEKLNSTWPGPVTWILPAAQQTSALLTGGRSTIAARVTAFEPALELCNTCGHALISTSANRSGDNPCTSADQAAQAFPELDYIIDLPVGTLKGPTPIFDGQTGKQLR